MPRIVRTTDKEQKDIEKIRAFETAERMKTMVNEYREAVEKELLDSISRMALSDLQDKQAEYKAIVRFIKWLDMEIAKGKKVISQRDKEEKLNG